METDPAPGERFRFGTFEADLRSGELRREGLKVKIQELPFQVLVALLERPGEVVTREELRKRLWAADTFVDFEHGLSKAINKLREALDDDANNPRFVETLTRRGYRFVGPVEAVGRPQAARPRAVRVFVLITTMVVAVLGALLAWLATRRPPPAPPQLMERRITFNPRENTVTQGVMSPDGKYLAYGDLTRLHLKLIQTGEITDIPQPEGPVADRGVWWPNDWFPDGSKFVTAESRPGQRPSAWVVSVMGGPPRKLRDDADPWAVSPDGASIAFGTGAGFVRNQEIWLMGPQGEEPRRFFPGSEDDAFFSAAWSPDGRRVAYQRYHRAPDKLECSIETRDPKGTSPTLVLSDPRLCESSSSLLWNPDGRLFFRLLEGAPRTPGDDQINLWEIKVDTKTGQAIGKPRRLTNWVGVNSWQLSSTQDGKRLAVSKFISQADVLVGGLDAGGRRLKGVRRLTLNDRNDYPGEWTPDSKAVLFWSDRNGTLGIYKQALDQPEAQPVVTGKDTKYFPCLSADGKWILYLSHETVQPVYPNGWIGVGVPVRIMRTPTSGGAPQLVLEGHDITGLACAKSPATNCVFSEVSESKAETRQLIFSAFDPLSGRGKELTRIKLWQPKPVYSWDLSPDGLRLGFTQFEDGRARIQILPLAGGEGHEIDVKGESDFSYLRWAPNGKGLFLGAAHEQRQEVLFVDLQGRANVLWQQGYPGRVYIWGVPSPDGRHLALLGRTIDNNVWMLENF